MPISPNQARKAISGGSSRSPLGMVAATCGGASARGPPVYVLLYVNASQVTVAVNMGRRRAKKPIAKEGQRWASPSG